MCFKHFNVILEQLENTVSLTFTQYTDENINISLHTKTNKGPCCMS